MISAWQKRFSGQFGKQGSICEEGPKWQLNLAGRWGRQGEAVGVGGGGEEGPLTLAAPQEHLPRRHSLLTWRCGRSQAQCCCPACPPLALGLRAALPSLGVVGGEPSRATVTHGAQVAGTREVLQLSGVRSQHSGRGWSECRVARPITHAIAPKPPAKCGSAC